MYLSSSLLVSSLSYVFISVSLFIIPLLIRFPSTKSPGRERNLPSSYYEEEEEEEENTKSFPVAGQEEVEVEER